MPQFARTKLVLQEYCFREKPIRANINYIGPNPSKLYYKVYDLMKVVFKVSDADIQEEKFNWGKGEKEKFKVRWYIHKDMDLFTYLYIRVDISGYGDEKSGKAEIIIKPVMRTEYPQDTIWQRSLFYEMMRVMWHRSFYFKKREEYADDCRNMTSILGRNIHEFLRQLREESG
ncbi:MAG: hypothetical protein KAS04_02075 [Candidatus Aenigmarchaeota archaeon]|nr:hypothetical protein [Candidatus Aenigmarchaeota archaeon]